MNFASKAKNTTVHPALSRVQLQHSTRQDVPRWCLFVLARNQSRGLMSKIPHVNCSSVFLLTLPQTINITRIQTQSYSDMKHLQLVRNRNTTRNILHTPPPGCAFSANGWYSLPSLCRTRIFFTASNLKEKHLEKELQLPRETREVQLLYLSSTQPLMLSTGGCGVDWRAEPAARAGLLQPTCQAIPQQMV